MKWWDKPLTPTGRAIVLVVMSVVGVLFVELATPLGYVTVVRGFPWVPFRYVFLATGAYGVYLLIAARRSSR